MLRPAASVYGAAVRRRNAHYDKPSAVRWAGVPVISVGNLTAGGTGKTPTVIAVVQRLQGWGRRPAILTRGYGAAAGQTPDEVQEFHAAVPAVPVVVNPDRVAGAAEARSRHGADCLVMDDGFQHRRLGRDLDIVLIDALDPWGGGALLPAGRLREPRESLRRAGLVLLTRTNQASSSARSALEHEVRGLAGETPLATATVAATGLVGRDGRALPLGELAERCVQPVCAIGNPATFLRLLRGLARETRQPLAFRDHHRYSPRDALTIAAAARDRYCDVVVTTRKDWGKLAPLWPDDPGLPPLLRLDVAVEIQDGDGVFEAALARAVGPCESES